MRDSIYEEEIPAVEALLPNCHFAVAAATRFAWYEQAWRGFGLDKYLAAEIDAEACGLGYVSGGSEGEEKITYSSCVAEVPVLRDVVSRMAKEEFLKDLAVPEDDGAMREG